MGNKIFKPVKSNIIHYSDELGIAEGLFKGYEIINRCAINPAIQSTGTHDMWSGTGLYTGFPTGPAEEFQIVLSDPADIGSYVNLRYLADYDSTEWSYVEVQTTDLITNMGVSGVRASRSRFFNDSTQQPNVGTVTIRHKTTTANIFAVHLIGHGQARTCCDTVPAGATAYIKAIECAIDVKNTANMYGALWTRPLGRSPRIFRNFSSSQNVITDQKIIGGIKFEGFTDFKLQILACSDNNITAFSTMDYILRTESA